MIKKFLWFIRGIIYKPFLGAFGFLSYIGSPILILGRRKIFIGNKVRIFPNARMESHNDGRIIIGDNTSIAQGIHIISAGEGIVEIKRDTTFSANVFITNIDHSYQKIGVHILEQEGVVKNTVIGENCFIGYGAVIQAGTILGKQCIVGSNAVVRGIFPDYCVIVGVPAKIIKRYDANTESWRKTNFRGEFINDI
ncbi:acyltransferase [[Pasteurella] aerogenes]|nr:acyltransferase [[Pasteurella] aerogenes]